MKRAGPAAARRLSRGPRLRVSFIAAALGLTGCFAEVPGWTDLPGDGITDVGPAPDMPPSKDARPGTDLAPEFDMASPMTDMGWDGMGFDLSIEPDLGPEPDMAPDRDMTPGSDMEPDLDMSLDMAPGPDMEPEPDMAPAPDMAPELDMGLPRPDLGPLGVDSCNGIDDDGDGIVDNVPACGNVIAERCRVFLGWADNNAGPADGSPTWGACPGGDEGWGINNLRCVGTREPGAFRVLAMPGNVFYNVDDNDDVGLAFRCDGGPAGVAEWIQSSCRVYIGQGDSNVAAAAEAWDDWGGCLAREEQENPAALDPGWNCVSSGGDGNFHRMDLLGNVDANDAFSIAFRCDDPADPARSEAMTASAAVILGWNRRDLATPADGVREWSTCPGPNYVTQDNGGDQRCASSAFDGRFHRFETSDQVDWTDSFGITLLPHPDSP